MYIAHIALTIMLSLLVTVSGVAKLRRVPHVVRVIHEVVHVPLAWFPMLATCEFAGAVGMLGGMLWPPIGLAAEAGLIIYFLGAVIAHVRVGDTKEMGSPVFLLALAVACLVTRFLSA